MAFIGLGTHRITECASLRRPAIPPMETNMTDLYARLLDEPTALIGACYDEAFRFTPEQIRDIQLNGARKRFAEMRGKIPVLDKLATEQGIDEIRSIDDVAPLLFAHTVYKS